MTARPADTRTGDAAGEETVVVRMRQGIRNLLIIAVFAGGLVSLVLGAGLLGLALCLFAVWQFSLVLRGKPGLLVDQRWADREGKPRIRSK